MPAVRDRKKPALENPILDEALRLASMGYSVLPLDTCNPGNPKKPHGLLVPNGVNDATTDENTIRSWFAGRPELGLGISTNNLMVMDFDKGGDQWLRENEELWGMLHLESPVQQATPSLGKHIVFRTPKGKDWRNTTKKLHHGVDTRANGGYIAAYPTTLAPYEKAPEGGQYRWLDGFELVPADRLPEVPEWLIPLLDSTSSTTTQSDLPPWKPREYNPEEVKEITGTLSLYTNIYFYERAYEALIEHFGWQFHSRYKDGEVRLTRPGKDPKDGYSASWFSPQGFDRKWGFPRFRVHSADDVGEFNAETSYSAFDILQKFPGNPIGEIKREQQQVHFNSYPEEYEDTDGEDEAGGNNVTSSEREPEPTDDDPRPIRRTPMEPFPTREVFPGEIADYVEALAEALMVDPAMVALPALATVAAAIGGRRHLRILPTWKEYPALWTVIVADSGSNKSAALEHVTRPLVDINGEMIREYLEELRNFREAVEKYRALSKDEKKEAEKPTPPSQNRIIAGDITIEALGCMLGGNPRGLFVIREELAAWFSSMTRYGDSDDSSHWLSWHDGKPDVIDRKMNPEPILLERPLVSVCGGIQPGVLASSLGAKNWSSGLAQRLLMAAPPAVPRKLKETPYVAGETHYRNCIRFLVGCLREQERVSATSITDPYSAPLEMDAEAQEVFRVDHDARCERAFGSQGGRAGQLFKLVSTGARWSICHHMLKAARLGEQGYEMVATDSVQAGIRLADWFERESARLLGVQSNAKIQSDLGEIIRLAVAMGDAGIAPRDVRNHCRKLAKDVASASDLLEQLCDERLMVMREVKQKRKTVKRYFVAPKS